MFPEFSTRRSVAQRAKTVLTGVAGAVLLAIAVYAGYLYWRAGFDNCRKEGSSIAWCVSTYPWQSFKTAFLN